MEKKYAPIVQKYLDGQVLLVDKPLEWTSFDAVNSIRAALRFKMGLRKIKVGHAGTLDPLATGLLIICTGKQTKKIEQYQAQEKEYTGTIVLGATTPSFDRETPVDKEFDIEGVSEKMVKEAAASFVGEIAQIPPKYSALKVDGMKACNAARKNIEIKMSARNVTIYAFEITSCSLPEIDFKVSCSKGTYIRTLADDLGKKLNNGAHLSALRRTKIGDFSVEGAMDPKAWKAQIDREQESVKDSE